VVVDLVQERLVMHTTGPPLTERAEATDGFVETMEEDQDQGRRENDASRLQLQSMTSVPRQEILDSELSENKRGHENRGPFPRRISYTRTFRRPKIENLPK
jgi:hypothetical protein